MDSPLQITFKDIESSEFVEARVRERVDRLEQFHPHVVACRVVVEVPHRGAESGKLPLGVSVEVDVPGRKLVAKAEEEMRELKGDRGSVINRAFDAMERQLEDAAAIMKRRVKSHDGSVEAGRVVRLFPAQSYGFIEAPGAGGELYFTANALQGLEFGELEVGQMVAITRATTDGPMGPQASSVRRVGVDTEQRGS